MGFRMDNGPSEGTEAVEELTHRRNNRRQRHHVVPQCLAKSPGLEKIALHIDNDERQAMRWELIGKRGSCNGRHGYLPVYSPLALVGCQTRLSVPYPSPPHLIAPSSPRVSMRRHMAPDDGHIRRLDQCLIDHLTDLITRIRSARAKSSSGPHSPTKQPPPDCASP